MRPARPVPALPPAAVLVAIACAAISACGSPSPASSLPRSSEHAAAPRVEEAPAVVVVRTGAAGAATGFVAGDDRVVTVAHVLDGTGLAVRSPGGGWTTATALCRDRDADLALLAAPGTSGAPLRVAPAEQGAPVLLPVVRGTAAAGGPGAAGGPAAVRGELRRRITAHVATGLGGASRRTLLELGVNARVGDFGAPVVTADGAVAGVLFARSVGRAGIAYAEDGAALRRLLAAGRCAPPR